MRGGGSMRGRLSSVELPGAGLGQAVSRLGFGDSDLGNSVAGAFEVAAPGAALDGWTVGASGGTTGLGGADGGGTLGLPRAAGSKAALPGTNLGVPVAGGERGGTSFGLPGGETNFGVP
ncbi:MAG TPA: hypothetical protein RMG48_09290, partial [Myxococcales bacterium LLY-WYZ-16_1]|nr:hypothetical protein [Myxococcales bacterium LLY-WYZ-16_1]